MENCAIETEAERQRRTSDQLLQEVLALVPDAVAIFDADGRMLSRNDRFAELSGDLTPTSVAEARSDEIILKTLDGGSVPAHVHRTRSGHLVVVAQSEGIHEARSRAVIMMLRAIRDGDDIFRAAASALAASVGWRWIGVTRFCDDQRAEVLAWWDTDRLADTFSYELAGTPCERVAISGAACAFERVTTLFPNDPELVEMGARYYAGEVYVDKDGHALGHVFMFDDREHSQLTVAKLVLSEVVELVGAQLRLQQLEQRSDAEGRAARTDPLTGLGNRLALDEAKLELEEAYLTGRCTDALLAVIDLDGMKAINDLRGHAAGDALLAAFAAQIRAAERANDNAYRTGGDEFVLVLLNIGRNGAELLGRRIAVVEQSLRDAGFPEMGASLGSASLGESGGDVKNALRLADERMYQHKQQRRLLGAGD